MDSGVFMWCPLNMPAFQGRQLSSVSQHSQSQCFILHYMNAL